MVSLAEDLKLALDRCAFARAQAREPQHVEAVKRDAGEPIPVWPSASVRKWSRRVACPREEGVESERELMMEDARSIREGLWRMAQLPQDAAESLDVRIEEEDLDGLAEAVEVREALERLQALSLEVSEELDAYQQRYAR
jgi:hypothetical protein